MNIAKKVAKFTINAFTFLLLAILVLIIYGKLTVTISKKVYPNFFGYTFFEVASGSMRPTLDINDVIVIKIGQKNIKKNDIIAFEYDNSIITHRVLSIDGNTLVVKGDNNNAIDKPITTEQVIGTMVKYYPKLGLWKKVMTDPKILIALFITLLLFDFAISYNKQEPKKEKKKTNSNKKLGEVVVTKVVDDNNPVIGLNEQEKILEFTRKIDLSEINKLIDDPDIKLNKNELKNIKGEIKKIETNGEETNLVLSHKEKEFLDYTIRLDLNEIRKKIDAKVK